VTELPFSWAVELSVTVSVLLVSATEVVSPVVVVPLSDALVV
jgi:hypothetical protein